MSYYIIMFTSICFSFPLLISAVGQTPSLLGLLCVSYMNYAKSKSIELPADGLSGSHSKNVHKLDA